MHGQVLSAFESSGAYALGGLDRLVLQGCNISVTSWDIGMAAWSGIKAAQS